MKIMHVLYQVNLGGIESLVMCLMRHFCSDAQFVFLTYKQEKFDYEDEIKKLGGKIIRISEPRRGNRINHINELIRVFKDERPDIVHCHTYFDSASVVYAAKKAGVRERIVHSHTTEPFSFTRNLEHYMMRKIINKYSTKRLACSKEAGKSLFGERADFTVIPNGMETEKYVFDELLREKIRRSLGIKEEVVIGHIGRFSDVKNHRLMVKIAENLRESKIDFRMVFIGDGKEFNNIKQLVQAKKLEKNIILLGGKKNANEYLNAFDVFLLPSKYEGLSTALIEAEFNGLPAVISDVIPNEAIIKEDVMKVSLLDSPRKWADDIVSITKNRKMPKKSEYEKYSFKTLIKNMRKQYGIRGEVTSVDKSVSVIVPTYNSSSNIKMCIESILSQTYKRFEIIVIDDGSTDNTKDIVRKYALKDNRVKIFSQKNSGPGIARLNGVKHATGDYIMFVDSDDYIKNNAIEKIVLGFAYNDIESIRFCGETSPGGGVFGKIRKSDIVMGEAEKAKLLLESDAFSSLWLQAFKREVFNGITMPQLKILYCEDYLTNFYIHQKIHNTLVLNDILYVYCNNSESTTRTKEKRKLIKNVEDRLFVSRKMTEEIKTTNAYMSYIDFDYFVAYQFDRVRRDLEKLLYRTDIEKHEFIEVIKNVFLSDDFLYLHSMTSIAKIKEYEKRKKFFNRIKNNRIIMDIYRKNAKGIWANSRIYRVRKR